MHKVMDRVVETQLKIYNTSCYRVWKLCFLGNRQPSLQGSIRVSGWQSGSQERCSGKLNGGLKNVFRKIK